MKKFICSGLAFAIISTVLLSAIPVDAVGSTPYAVCSSGDLSFSGSGTINGDVMITGGVVSGREHTKAVTGTVYTANGATVGANPNLTVEDFSGDLPIFPIATYGDVFSADYFVGSEYNDGTQTLTVGWSGDAKPNNYTLESDAYLGKLYVSPTLNINIAVEAGKTRVLRVSELVIEGTLTIVGEGNVILFVEKTMQGSANGQINGGGSASNMAIVFGNNIDSIKVDTFKKICTNIFMNNTDILFNNTTLIGNVYTAGNVGMTNSGSITGLVYAPNSDMTIKNSCYVIGQVVTKTLSLSGSAYVQYGLVSDVPEFVKDGLILDNGSPEDNDGEMVTIKIVVPRRMSVRLEDGTVFKNGDTFDMATEGTIRFQMCTNNWDTDSYDDNGNGIAGTKVYTYSHQKKSDNTLRTDTNTYFMAVRYDFEEGNYNKQTGIKNVLSKPLESLSVNLPLGSTITSDAYKDYNYIASANIFVETAEDKMISYTDYYWPY